ncbi:MAG TPA: hypothetical protein VEL07_15550 [Planctomycetota bacterium]|nr:hypothetical protein [Planctomycetota bacterium]
MRFLLVIAAAGVFSGCANRVSKERFYQLCEEANADNRIVHSLPGRVFYQGSKKGLDYFLIDPPIWASDQVAVKAGEISQVKRRFPYTRRRERWAFLEFSPRPIESVWDPIWPPEGPPN